MEMTSNHPSRSEEVSSGFERTVRGTTLRAALRDTRSLPERLNLLPHVVDVCRAVGVAHSRGIIHRGLHPSIIMLTEFGECIVSDWSLSKARRKEDARGPEFEAALESLRNSNIPLNPPSKGEAARDPSSKGEGEPGWNQALRLDPAFLAPELALGHMESVDARSDVYALGAVLYELLTGQPPFTGENSADVLSAAGSKKPAPVPALEPTVATELVNICERAMHQEPSARYASAKHLAEELERAVLSLPKVQSIETQSEAFLAGTVTREAGLKHRIALALVAALLVLVIAVAAVSQRRVVRERDQAMASLRDEEQQRAEVQRAHDALARDLEDAQSARREAEAERDQAEAARRQAVENASKTQEQLKKAQDKLTQQPPTQESTATAPPEEQAQAQTAETAGPPMAFPRNMPAKFLGPYAANQKGDAAQRPPGVTRGELAKALPQLISALKMEKTQGDKMAVMVGTPGSEVNESLQLLGFKGGDVITNINRSTIENVDQAKKAFDGVGHDSGFTVRIVRDGQSSWMRVNVFEKLPPVMPAKPPPQLPKLPKALPRMPAPPEVKQAPPPETSSQEPPEQSVPPAEEAPPTEPQSAEQPEAQEPPPDESSAESTPSEEAQATPEPASEPPEAAPAAKSPSTESTPATEPEAPEETPAPEQK
jgi:hypothetical protein